MPLIKSASCAFSAEILTKRWRILSKSRDLRKGLADSDPKNLEWQRDLAVGYAHAGDALIGGGDDQKALDQYHPALVIRKSLAASDPTNPQWQSDLALDHRRLGIAGEDPKSNFERALDIVRKLQAEKKLPAQYAGLPEDLEKKLADARQ